MAVTNLQKNQHLLWRAGFGPSIDDVRLISEIDTADLLRRLMSDSSTSPAVLDVADHEIKTSYQTAGSGMGRMNMNNAREQKTNAEKNRRRLAQLSRQNIKQLNLEWLNQMVLSKQQLREKMSLFWHGHFAATSGNILHQQQLLDVIRQNALGNFGDLLRGVSRSATMINYLNNNQNRKNRPNENFAREVMELFTLGRGQYSENDIKEAARAFTGWGANGAGDFVFRKQQHDAGSKTIFGRSGNFNGDDVLNMLLENKQTAIHITRRIYRYYVNENVDQLRINTIADTFYKSGYNITTLLKAIFESDWFYHEQNIGNHIKSPVELIVGLRRTLPLEIRNPEVQLLIQRLLGQVLFYPPNVAGWPGGNTWIDSSSLMLRMQLPKMIVEAQELRLAPKDDDDQMMGMKEPEPEKVKKNPGINRQHIHAVIDWSGFTKSLFAVKRDQIVNSLTARLLLARPPDVTVINKFADQADRENYIRTCTILLMCMPEYQLS